MLKFALASLVACNFCTVKLKQREKMEFQVQLISQSFVKPSSPTPDHLRRCQFSSIDQIMLPIFSPWLYFYPRKTNLNNIERCRTFKDSLSETLTLFHPLAGRVRDNMYIDCNDEGVPFVEAKATCTILDVLQNPSCNELNKLLPYGLDGSTDLVAFVQVTYFRCGGLAVGLALSHKIADAFSVVTFLASWAAIARGDRNNVIVPRFDAAKYFPPITVSDFDPGFEIDTSNDKTVLKRFVFSASSLAALRDKYADKSDTRHPIRPTRAEALTCFIWSRFMASTQCKENNDKIYTVLHPMNLRPRMDPPLSEHHFGNLIVKPVVAFPDIEAADGSYGIVSQMRDAVKKVDMDYIRILQQGEPHLNMVKERAERVSKKQEISMVFTNVSAFPIYEIDFGWGLPVWVGTARWALSDLVIFVSTKTGNGIEVFIHMKQEDMAKFEKDDELAEFVSPFPNLNIPSAL